MDATKEDMGGVYSLGCNQMHLMHRECFESYKMFNDRAGGQLQCPFCRANVDLSNMRKVKFYSAKLKRVETYTEIELQKKGQAGEHFVERAPWEQASPSPAVPDQVVLDLNQEPGAVMEPFQELAATRAAFQQAPIGGEPIMPPMGAQPLMNDASALSVQGLPDVEPPA